MFRLSPSVRRPLGSVSGNAGGLNGSTQHFPEVYSQESENLKSLAGVDLSAALLCSDPTGNSRLGLRSSGSIVVRARLCFRSSRVARDSADNRSRLSHPWPPILRTATMTCDLPACAPRAHAA